MKNLKKLFLLIVVSTALIFSGCKYEEGPGISFRSKRDRLANEWKATGYQIDGNDDAAALKSFKSAGDSIELIFTMTRNFNYSLNMAYADGYTSPSGDKYLAPSANDDKTYVDILGVFSTDNELYKQLGSGGKWGFSDKYKKVNYGVNGAGDLSHPDADDKSIITAEIIMLKNKSIKLDFPFNGKKHTITFEPKNKEIVK